MNKKRLVSIIIIAALFAVSFVAGLLLKRGSAPGPGPVISPTPQPATQPVLPSPEYTGNTTYTAGSGGRFPTTVPVYRVGSPQDALAALRRVADLTGVGGNPRASTGSDGTHYYLSGGGVDIGAGGNPLNVSYNTRSDLSQPLKQTEADMVASASSFLQNAGFPGTGLTLEKTGISYLKPSAFDPIPAPSVTGATLAQIDFRYMLDGFPVVTSRPDTPAAMVQLAAAGDVYSFRAFRFPEFTKEAGEAGIITYDEAVGRLQNNRGVLVNVAVEATTNSMYYLTQAPDSASVYKTEVGLSYSPGEPVLSPVFIFYGNGSVDSLAVKTVTVVSAAPDVTPTTAP